MRLRHLILIALGITGLVAALAERPKPVQANFSDSILFDQREYWERAIWQYQTIPADAYGGGIGVTAANPSINNRVGGNLPTGKLCVDVTLPYVWGLNNHNSGAFLSPDTVCHPGANASIWAGDIAEVLPNAKATFDPFAASGATEYSGASQQTTIGVWGRVSIMEAIACFDDAGGGAATCGAIAPTADTKTGMGMGTDTSKAITATPKRPLALIYADNLQTAPRWTILLCKGGNATAVTQVLSGVDAPALWRHFRLRLVYNPIRKYLAGVVNGVEGGRITNPTAFPDQGAPTNCQFNVFAQSGTGTGAEINCAFWYPTIRTYYASP